MKLYRPIPPEGKVVTEGEITNIYDKGKGALIIWTMRVLTETGEILAEAEHTIFYVGAGGFGGDPGPKAEALNPPEKMEPDFTASYFAPENQAALYRLNGDTNPLHVDPEFAAMGGFPRPILHGLCTSQLRCEQSCAMRATEMWRDSRSFGPVSLEWSTRATP